MGLSVYETEKVPTDQERVAVLTERLNNGTITAPEADELSDLQAKLNNVVPPPASDEVKAETAAENG